MMVWLDQPGTIWAMAPVAWGYRYPAHFGRPMYLRWEGYHVGHPLDCLLGQTRRFMQRYSVTVYS